MCHTREAFHVWYEPVAMATRRSVRERPIAPTRPQSLCEIAISFAHLRSGCEAPNGHHPLNFYLPQRAKQSVQRKEKSVIEVEGDSFQNRRRSLDFLCTFSGPVESINSSFQKQRQYLFAKTIFVILPSLDLQITQTGSRVSDRPEEPG